MKTGRGRAGDDAGGRTRRGHDMVWLVLLLCVAVAGCDPHQDPMDRPGTWSLAPAGLTSNDENLRTMLINPNDLISGQAADGSDGRLAARPVQRLVTGHRAVLPVEVGTEIPAPAEQQPGGASGGSGGPGTQ